MSRAYSNNGRSYGCFQIITGSLQERCLQEDSGLDGRTTVENIFKKQMQIDNNTRNWIHSTQDRGYWKAFINATLKLRVPYSMEMVIQLCPTCFRVDYSGLNTKGFCLIKRFLFLLFVMRYLKTRLENQQVYD